MMNRFCMLLLGMLWASLSAGCAMDVYNRPEFVRFKKDSAGEIVLRSLIYQGYIDWQGETGMACSLRSVETRNDTSITKIDQLSFDMENNQIHGRTHRGAAIVNHAYTGGRYWERVDQEPIKAIKQLGAGCRALVDDYLFTMLPFLVGRYAIAFELEKPEVIDRVRYNVVVARFPTDGLVPPDAWYKLFYTHTTNRLEKVFFMADSGQYTGRYIWCEFDNYADLDGVLIPLHRVFTLAKDKSGVKESRPFLQQWVYDLEFGSVDSLLFEEQES
ncbi:MAG: hypothetical protein ABIK28_01770 [Planctomycetota bacterium]